MIPLYKGCIVGKEKEYIAEAMESGALQGNGPFTQKCEKLLQDTLGAKKVILTPSGTQALEMASYLLNIENSDVVIVPSYTFVSTANAFCNHGAEIGFCDITQNDLNMNVNDLPEVFKRCEMIPRVLVPVHYAGVSCQMNEIMELAEEKDLAVVEDNAHGLYGKYHNKYLGTIGDFGILSFQTMKNFTCGEGGALIINNPEYIERAEIIRDKGTNRSKFFRGEVAMYTWVDMGSSYVISELQAAFLYGQLMERETIQQQRAWQWWHYQQDLWQWCDHNGVKFCSNWENKELTYHIFYLIFPNLKERTRFITYMKFHKVTVSSHYVSLHLSSMGGERKGLCPVSELVSDCLVRLPLFHDLTVTQQDHIINVIKKFKVAKK